MRYCFVCEIKEEQREKFIEMVKTQSREILQAHKDAGMHELLQWIYKNIMIIYYEGDEIDKVEEKLNKVEMVTKWDEITYPMLEVAYAPAEKICDLNQQLEGKLEPF
jgi:L-rhamnose mutarotase